MDGWRGEGGQAGRQGGPRTHQWMGLSSSSNSSSSFSSSLSSKSRRARVSTGSLGREVATSFRHRLRVGTTLRCRYVSSTRDCSSRLWLSSAEGTWPADSSACLMSLISAGSSVGIRVRTRYALQSCPRGVASAAHCDARFSMFRVRGVCRIAGIYYGEAWCWCCWCCCVKMRLLLLLLLLLWLRSLASYHQTRGLWQRAKDRSAALSGKATTTRKIGHGFWCALLSQISPKYFFLTSLIVRTLIS
jgi:hypothetical protein